MIEGPLLILLYTTAETNAISTPLSWHLVWPAIFVDKKRLSLSLLSLIKHLKKASTNYLEVHMQHLINALILWNASKFG